jgi:hypothetical protein
LKVAGVPDLGLSEEDLAPRTFVEEVYFPPETAGAEMLEGDAGTVAERILQIIKEKGVKK